MDLWVDQLSLLGSSLEHHEEKSHKVFYVLQETREKGVLLVTIQTRRFLKRGGFSKETPVNLNGYSYATYFTKADREIAQLFEQIQEGHYISSTYLLKDLVGAVLLNKMISTGACHYGSSDGPRVQKGGMLRFKVEWCETESEKLKLVFISQKERASILRVEPLMYLDRDTYEVGLVEEIAYGNEMIELILDAPEVDKEDASYLSKRLLIDLPRVNLPVPQNDFITIVDELSPTFIMNIEDTTGLFKASVSIRYGEENVKLVPFGESELIKDRRSDKYIKILRDVATEKEAVARLDDLGLTLYDVDKLYALGARFRGDKQAQYAAMESFFSEGLELLRQDGWQINLNEASHISFEAVEQIEGRIDENNHWFDLRFDININGKSYNTIPIIASLLNSTLDIQSLPEKVYLEIDDGSVAVVDKKTVMPIMEILFELFDHEENGFKLHTFDAPVLTQLQNAAINFAGSSRLLDIAKKLETFEGISRASIPKGLNASLRDYQVDGYSWLQFLREYSFGGILADDMGLGKTIQTLTHLLKEKEDGRLDKPSLVVAPTSLMSNWRKEVEKFTPELKVLVLQGLERREHFERISEYDIVLTTYPLIARDFDKYIEKSAFYYLILDEAQNIKNHKSKAAQYLRAIKSEHRLCLTGTPMENHLGELWGLFDFLMPGFLFNNKFFNENLRNPIEKEQDMQKQSVLNARVKPFLLRRTKSEVATELPPKTEIIQTVPFGKKQAALYESIRVAMDKQVQDAIKDKGFARSQIMILDALLKLRQVCCDPRLVKLERAKEIRESAKFEMLFDLLLEQIEEGRKILLFSQFTSMLALIEERLKEEKIDYTKLTGSTRKREEAIERFTSGEVPLFLISLKAGGVGLNLTQADTVIHYDPWWNPAAENQATDRAYRIGQDKPVFVYKLIVENTLEEKIIELQKRKQALADNVYKNKADAIGLSQDDLSDLFKPL